MSQARATVGDYEITALTTGFRVTGAFLVADGNVGDMVLSFTATVAQGLQIDAGRLFFNDSFNGENGVPPGLGVGVTETIFAGGSGNRSRTSRWRRRARASRSSWTKRTSSPARPR